MALVTNKVELRRHARHLRKQTHSESGQEASRRVVDFGLAGVADIWGATPPGVIAGYLAVGSELDALPLMTGLQQQGWSLALPVVTAPDTPLTFRHWRKGDSVEAGSFGISEPEAEAAEVRPDVVLAPLLAFDDDGYRLGQGGGFYDRTLARWQAEGHTVTVLGLAFGAQRVATVPRDEYDQRLAGIITENGWRRFGGA